MSVYTSVPVRRLVAAALAAGALVGSAAVSASAAPGPRAERSPVAISRVQSDAPGVDNRSNGSLNGEWVEVTNSTWRAVSLNGWTLSDRDGNRYTFRHYRLAARSTVRVHTGVGHDTAKDLFQDRRREVWDNRSDVATLKTDHGRFVDSVSWGQRHDRDHDRDNGRGQDHGRDHDRNTGRDHDRNTGRGQEHGHDHDRGRGHDGR
ncbi:lamin tail domain-containing protein [Streptomyces sp. NPDC060011]|uniref:lamin tail domain-containing protein n=1 Tax=unclassified Streptomyces TaxID=2593676 RepID=UPI0013B69D0F|nr:MULTISPECIES: lamin tail domain-containing protein [unclassified Streptomyces]MCX4912322.1 lamin tail domain-containing protein [Streptomyces sp. NBC_00687]MCX5136773.1 lamin tail domain-containing protein [Streptomyces sp. NBC_00340]MCX5285277.1 lamin tail domain-containing protein [Streptomyces sp. NBC_00198]NEB34681.1 lamin tail domain-containing protein [Streptomyces sp. SID14446]WSD82442.1 lamin tail domain-containing protein [Streptomyces sp. NBC_01558]